MHRAAAVRPWLLVLVTCLFSHPANADSPTPLAPRPPWTSSRIVGTPEPPAPYTTERAFADIQFDQPIEMIAAPGTDRLFVAELLGKIYSFEPQSAPAKDLMLDLKAAVPDLVHIYGMAFHPHFAENRYCYICYVLAPDLPDGTRVSRFTVSTSDPPVIDPASEEILITWPSGGHNGGCLRFGPDGYLYISTGDGTGPNPPDILKTGQDVSDLLSSILRIDVDHRENGKPYRVPDNNPFVQLEYARPEVYAYGLRNPWKMCFHPETGDLLVGDVGWELWEMIYRVQPGGNYGWAVMEGRQPTNPEWPRGPTPIFPPLVDHPHSESASITGGYYSRDPRLPDLAGAYVYGDYETGKIWALRHEGDTLLSLDELCDTTHQIICFAETHAGELYVVDYRGGIYQLVPNPESGTTTHFPQKLSETGLFADTAAHAPAPGVVRYTINAPSWADHATAERFVALPESTTIGVEAGKWTWPAGAVLAKTLSLELERGNPQSRRRIETQILHFDGIDWRGYTYVWSDDQRDAELLDAAGRDRVLEIRDAKSPENVFPQTWHFASRAECARCHNPWSGPPLAFIAPQLDRPYHDGSRGIDQLEVLRQLHVLSAEAIATRPPPLVDPADQTANLELRARSYLHTNCAHCHRMHAGSAVLSQMPYDLKLEETRMLGERPSQGTFNLPAAEVIAPGDPYRSVLLYRMAKLGNGHMPHLGSNVLDLDGIALICEWIEQLGASASAKDSDANSTAQLRDEEQQLLDSLCQATSPDAAKPLVAQLLGRTSGALRLRLAIDQQRIAPEIAETAVQVGSTHTEVTVRDLFEPLVPEDQRVKRLGNVVNTAELLAMEASVERGRELWRSEAMQCKSCHRIGGEGGLVGPDLSQIGRKYDRAQLLRELLQPSEKIDPQYITWLVETSDGQVLTGVLKSRTESEIVLMDAQGKQLTVSSDNIEQMVPQSQSLMPEQLLRDMTPQQVADLLAYLSSCQ